MLAHTEAFLCISHQNDFINHENYCYCYYSTGVRFWITDVAMVTDTFLNDVEVEDDTRERLETLCELLEDCVR